MSLFGFRLLAVVVIICKCAQAVLAARANDVVWIEAERLRLAVKFEIPQPWETTRFGKCSIRPGLDFGSALISSHRARTHIARSNALFCVVGHGDVLVMGKVNAGGAVPRIFGRLLFGKYEDEKPLIYCYFNKQFLNWCVAVAAESEQRNGKPCIIFFTRYTWKVTKILWKQVHKTNWKILF